MYVAQLNLYVPDDVAARLKREAELQGQSLSKYVVSQLVQKRTAILPFGPEFFAGLDALGPMPVDFVAPPREVDTQDLNWAIDDLSA